MNLEGNILSEIIQTEKDKYNMSILIEEVSLYFKGCN